MIQCTVKGDFKKSNSFLKRLLKLDFNTLLKRYAEEGVEALASATPIRTGLTAASWNYEIVKDRHSVSIFGPTRIWKMAFRLLLFLISDMEPESEHMCRGAIIFRRLFVRYSIR